MRISRLSKLTAVAALACAAALGTATAATAAPHAHAAPAADTAAHTYTWSGQAAGHVTERGSVAFKSDGSVTVTGTGTDISSDGYGPYLFVYSFKNRTKMNQSSQYTSCAAGDGGTCTLPALNTGGSTSSPVLQVELEIDAGSGGYSRIGGSLLRFDRDSGQIAVGN